jgi:hypothetical protein
VPRLSIIIPHRNDQQLEETILSVLENRPRDCEIIVAHNGSYGDPYHLADEVVYVQEEAGSTVVELLNAGLMATCSPVVCTLIDGAVVSTDWAELPLKRFARQEVATVAPQLQVGRSAVSGIAEQSIRSKAKLRSGKVESTNASAVAPTIAAGFYRRKLLLALGGWNDEVSAGTADVELALLMSDLGLICECESQVVVRASSACLPSRNSKEAISELAGIAAAHGTASASLGATMAAVLPAVFTGSVAAALAWSSGLKNSRVIQEVSERLAYAKKQLNREAVSIKFQTEALQTRRAA